MASTSDLYEPKNTDIDRSEPLKTSSDSGRYDQYLAWFIEPITSFVARKIYRSFRNGRSYYRHEQYNPYMVSTTDLYPIDR